MTDNTPETAESVEEVREFQVGEVAVKQKARVSQLQSPKYRSTYLIDITDQVDPTTQDPHDKTFQGKVVAEMLEGKLGNPANSDHYASNNGVLALIADRLDKSGRRRLYMGIEMSNPQDDESAEITSHILSSMGFQQGTFYVPFSFDSGLAKSYVGSEIQEALSDRDPTLFGDYKKLLLK